jgi:hypothetical protein
MKFSDLLRELDKVIAVCAIQMTICLQESSFVVWFAGVGYCPQQPGSATSTSFHVSVHEISVE